MKRWELSRRTFLRGAGTVLALPVLDAMAPAIARAATGSPVRMLFYYVPCGKQMDAWMPSGTGGLTLSQTLQPLAQWKNHINVVDNMLNHGGEAQADGAGDHARGTGAFLTCVHPLKTVDGYRAGTSVDQVLANHYDGQTQIRSLQLGLEPGGNNGNCDSGYACAYTSNISWANATTPLNKVNDPQAAFNQFVLEPDQTALTRAHALGRRQRVMDLVREDANRLANRLGVRDKQKLDQYLTSVDELDTRFTAQRQDLESGAVCQGNPPVSGGDAKQELRNMIDVMVLAFQCDVTRVISFMRGNGGSDRNTFVPGVSHGNHDASHHGTDNGKLVDYQKINQWDVEQFAYLVQRLATTDDGDAKLIDNSLAFYSSEIADGDAHAHDRLPVILAGHGGGAVQGNRFIVAPNRTPIANLFASMLNIVGAGTSFADSTGMLSGLTA